MSTPMFRYDCDSCGHAHISPADNRFGTACGRQKCEGRLLRGDTAQPMAIALSGGGFRASLFALGVLMALVDLSLNRRTGYIASVSGGSITNGFIGTQGAFEQYTPDDFEKVAGRFARMIVERGLLTVWVGLAILALLLSPALVLFLAAKSTFGGVMALLAGLLLGFLLLQQRGVIVERLFRNRLFLDPKGNSIRLADFPSGSVEHVICCTEIVSGCPAYFSSSQGGRLLLRLPPNRLGNSPWYECRCDETQLASAVVASAAFPPYIPPRRLARHEVGESVGQSRDLPDWPLMLSDGGIWSNIATQSLLEDVIVRGSPALTPEFSIILVANASAAPRPTSRWPFRVPVLAFLSLALRAASIQGDNTVTPRIEHIRSQLRRQLKTDSAGSGRDPQVATIELATDPVDAVQEYTTAQAEPGTGMLDFAEGRSWTRNLIDELIADPGSAETVVARELKRRPVPEELNRSDSDALARNYRDLEMELEKQEGPRPPRLAFLPTRLGRINSVTAMRLILRGYANTHVAAHALQLTRSVTIAQDLTHRLSRIVGMDHSALIRIGLPVSMT